MYMVTTSLRLTAETVVISSFITGRTLRGKKNPEIFLPTGLLLNMRVPWVIMLRCVDAEEGKRKIPFNKAC
jgi:hypothetical protein